MNKVTRRQKQEAVELLQSRILSDDLAQRFLGYVETAAQAEAEGVSRSVGNVLAMFVRGYNTEIRQCPLTRRAMDAQARGGNR